MQVRHTSRTCSSCRCNSTAQQVVSDVAVMQVVQHAQQSFEGFLTQPWSAFQKQSCDFQQQQSANQSQAETLFRSDRSSSNHPPSIKTVVSIPEQKAADGTSDATSAELQRDESKSTHVADVKANVSNHKGKQMRKGQVVWRVPYIVSEQQAAVLRKIATLAFRLDRHNEVELCLRVAVRRS